MMPLRYGAQRGRRWDLVVAVWEKGQGRCGLCGEDMDPEAPAAITIDHILPRSRGGSDELDNLQLAHKRCNSRKRNKDTMERAPKSPTAPLVLSPELLARVDEFRWGSRMPSRSAAMKYLMEWALNIADSGTEAMDHFRPPHPYRMPGIVLSGAPGGERA